MIYKERRLYFSQSCKNCLKKFQSFKRSKIKHGLCRNCRKNAVDPNQQELFPKSEIESEKVEYSLEGKGGKEKLVGKVGDKTIFVAGFLEKGF